MRYERPPPMTSTTSPGRTSPASQRAVASTDPGAATGIDGASSATARASDPTLPEVMHRAGVDGPPQVWITEDSSVVAY